MWKTLSDWLFALFNMSRELQEHRETIRQLDERVRNTEEAVELRLSVDDEVTAPNANDKVLEMTG